MTPWHEDDELWGEFLSVLSDDSMVTAAAQEAPQAAALLGVEPGAHLLDLCCGPGRHAVELARLGYRVTGVDRTAAYLEHARERAAAAGVEVELVLESMLDFRRNAAFDGAVNLLTSIGYFEERNDDLQVLRNLHASLKPGARLVVDLFGKEILARRFVSKHWQQGKDGRFWIQEREIVAGWEKNRVRWIFMGGDRPAREFVFEHRIYSGVELADLLRQAGFAEVSLHGALDGRPYDWDAQRLVVVARRLQ